MFLPYILLFLHSSYANDASLTFEDFYQYGKNEYTHKNWPDCVAYMRRAVEDFRHFEDELVFCRKKCGQQVEEAENNQLSQLHAVSQRALCILRCRKDRFGENRPPIRKMSTYFDMMERKPYEYIHICYWHQGELSLAVQSAYTFLVRNPDKKDILDALSFYMKQDEYRDEMLVDALRRPYETRYISGVDAYMDEDWGKCVDDFEQSLDRTFEEDERCRLICIDKVDWGAVAGSPEIDVLATSMYSSVIRCQHNCLYRLSLINGHIVGHLIASHYEYLHYCYYKLQRGSEASRSVANYLLFDDNPLMRRNKYMYMKQYKKEELFKPDQRMLDVFKKRELEERYLNFIEEKFKIVNNEFPPEQADDRKKFVEEVIVRDSFGYSSIENLLSPSECKLLRSIFPASHSDSLQEEIERRIRIFYPNVKYENRLCSSSSRSTSCDRPLVLSIDEADCSAWLGRIHSGCSIIFCV